MASTAASQRSPQKKPRSSLGLLGFWALLLACSSAMFFACAYALDAVPDNVLALLLRAGILFFGSVMIPLALATGLWFAGIKGRRAITVALFVSASSALAGYVHWRDVPMPWDDIVRAPQYIETRAWQTLYDWQADPEQVPWNVLEPAFPRIERVFTRPQASATRAQVRQSDFRWHSIYFLRASGFRIFGRFELDDAGNARNVYGFLRLPASPYLELQRGTETNSETGTETNSATGTETGSETITLQLDFQPEAKLKDYQLEARLGSGENAVTAQVTTRANGATLQFPAELTFDQNDELIVTLRDPANERTLLFRFLRLDAL